MLEGLLSVGEILLLKFYLTLHEHEHRVFTDFEVLGEGLLKIVLCCFGVSGLTVDKSGEHMGLNESRVFLEAVVQLPESGIGVIGKPFGLGENQLSVCETTILLCNVFKQLDGLDEVLWWGLV